MTKRARSKSVLDVPIEHRANQSAVMFRYGQTVAAVEAAKAAMSLATRAQDLMEDRELRIAREITVRLDALDQLLWARSDSSASGQTNTKRRVR